MVDFSVQIGSLIIKNPVITASGTFGYGTEFGKFFNLSLLGGIVTKTITLNPRDGNPMPRTVETASGMLNSIGLANIGVDRFINEKLPALEGLDTAIFVNIAGSTIEEYVKVVERVGSHDRVDAIEVNVSCPNVKQGGLAFGTDPNITHNVLSSLRNVTEKPLIAKLTPNVTDIVSIAIAAVEGGADAVSLINTVLGMKVDIRTKKTMLASSIGGLSGPAIKPIALAKVYQVVKAVDVPVIGIGGIMNWNDALEFLIVGASAVQVGTLNFVDPKGAIHIINGIEDYCKENEIEKVKDLVCTINEG
jgi:dihydroorotate dehydrogenase (NAD+) catalytic subunit